MEIDVQDHGIGVGVSLKGKQLIDFYIQQDEPAARKVGDVWIRTDTALNNISISDKEPATKSANDVWQTVDRLDYSILVEGVESVVNSGNNDIFVAANYESFLKSIPSDKQLLWENVYLKAYGNPKYTRYYDSTRQDWVNMDSFRWDGTSWVQISFVFQYLYDNGHEEEQFIAQTSVSSGGSQYWEASKQTDHLYMLSDPSSTTNYRWSTAEFVTEKMIDVTNYDKLGVEWEYVVNDGSASFGLSTTSTADRYQTYVASVNHETTSSLSSGGRVIEELDVRNLSGNYYIKVRVHGNYGRSFVFAEAKAYRIWLTKDV